MKQLYIINNSSIAEHYGIGTYIEQLITCLNTCANMQVTVITLDSQESELTEKQIKDVRYILFPTVQIHQDKKHSKRYARNVAYALYPYIDLECDIIFHFNYSYHIWLAEAFKFRFPNCRIVITLHYLTWCFDLSANTHYFRSILNKKEEERDDFEECIYKEYQTDKCFYNLADKVICLCEATKSFLHEVYHVPCQKTVLIHNGLKDEEKRLSEEEKRETKIKLGFNGNEKIVLFVGRINKLKGIHWLIDSFRKLLKKYPEARLVITGDGRISEYLKLSIGMWSKVIFTGELDKEQVYELYRIADLGVLPSMQEQCSYVVIEMMMHSLPLVGTNAMGISEMIEKECQVSLNVHNDNISLCTDSLCTLIHKAIEQKKILGRKSRQRYENFYSLNIKRNKMEIFYKDL